LAHALSRREALIVRDTVAEYLRRTPTRSKITSARRAARRLVESGQASVPRVPRPESDSGPGGQYLILFRPGTNLSQRELDSLAPDSTDATRGRSRRAKRTPRLAWSWRAGGQSREVGWSGSRDRRRPTRHRHAADAGRLRPNRAGDVPYAEGDQRRAEGQHHSYGLVSLALGDAVWSTPTTAAITPRTCSVGLDRRQA
jgi:hypothetical protein